MNRADRLVLVTIIVLAVGLRLWGIGFGLPYPYHADEPTYVSAALNLGAGIIGRQPNPTGFSNMLFGEYAAYFLTGRLAGLFSSTAAFEQTYRTDPSFFLLLSRLTSAFFGSTTVLVVYWLGTRANRRTAGLLASLFLAVAFLHVRDSHYGVPDVAAPFFISLSVLFCIIANQKRQVRYLCCAALATGFAVATKWSVWPIGVTLFITIVSFFGWQLRQTTTRNPELFRNLLLVVVSLALGFTVGGFQIILKPGIYLEYALREAQAGEAGGFGFWQIDTLSGWGFYLKTLLYGLGGFFLVSGILGLARRGVMAVVRRDVASAVLVSFPLIYFLVMGSTQHYFGRYALPLVPFIALFAAELVVAAYAWLLVKNRAVAWAITMGLSLGILVTPLANSIQHDVLLTKVDTRTMAKEWIEANLPADAKIAADWPIHTPFLAGGSQPMTTHAAEQYDVHYIGGSGLSEHALDWYRQQGFDYLIASSFIYNIPLVFPEQDAERKTFYQSLQEQLPLVKVFPAGPQGADPPFLFDEIYGPAISLWQRERPGPTLKIYGLASQ